MISRGEVGDVFAGLTRLGDIAPNAGKLLPSRSGLRATWHAVLDNSYGVFLTESSL